MEAKVIALISEASNIEAAKITGESSFIDDLNFDSLDVVELMMKVEDEFGIDIPEEEAEKLKTVSDVISYIKSKQ